ncbi:MAG TPA: tagaturonate epimerase family protein [Sedimentisphaerales bacterium]|nr:tagaturonate epimerase family protein [Sedimentisphaerales bacterium]
MILEKYSFGIGDRFCHQGKAQLSALMKAKEQGLSITPVWNKSHREHTIIGTTPADTRKEALDAVKALQWDGPYFVDADHIGPGNVDRFIESSDFFTLDVADFITQPADKADVDAFVKKYSKYIGSLAVEGIEQSLEITEERIRAIGGEFLLAVRQAGGIYRHIAEAKGAGSFITEVSMDETDQPQTPVEMLFILAAIAEEGIPAQTIAPKFTGRFNKGVDYVGDVTAFAKEFEEDLAVVNFAVREFGLPENLKLSIHSGSDKFSIYAPIAEALKKFDAGLHVKTAGTTWLEELIGLAMAAPDGLSIAKEVYAKALHRFGELCGPYATVIDIYTAELPTAEQVDTWDGMNFASALRHDQSCEQYNPNFRQLLHVAYKIAAEMGTRFSDALDRHEAVIAQNVAENIYDRHVRPVFMECR